MFKTARDRFAESIVPRWSFAGPCFDVGRRCILFRFQDCKDWMTINSVQVHRPEREACSSLWPHKLLQEEGFFCSFLFPLPLSLQIIKFSWELFTKFLWRKGGSFHAVSAKSCFKEKERACMQGTNSAYLSALSGVAIFPSSLSL
jgi:hypothetical protein